MGGVTRARTLLGNIVCREVDLYAGNTHQATLHAILDNENQKYAVAVVPENSQERPAWISVMARVVGDYVVIDEDTSLDKPLVEALMVNGGIPREKIILAYKGEQIPPTPDKP